MTTETTISGITSRSEVHDIGVQNEINPLTWAISGGNTILNESATYVLESEIRELY